MKKCANCGHLNPDSAKFCQKCGTPLTSNPHSDSRSNNDQNNVKVVRKHHGCLWLVLIMIISDANVNDLQLQTIRLSF